MFLFCVLISIWFKIYFRNIISILKGLLQETWNRIVNTIFLSFFGWGVRKRVGYFAAIENVFLFDIFSQSLDTSCIGRIFKMFLPLVGSGWQIKKPQKILCRQSRQSAFVFLSSTCFIFPHRVFSSKLASFSFETWNKVKRNEFWSRRIDNHRCFHLYFCFVVHVALAFLCEEDIHCSCNTNCKENWNGLTVVWRRQVLQLPHQSQIELKSTVIE